LARAPRPALRPIRGEDKLSACAGPPAVEAQGNALFEPRVARGEEAGSLVRKKPSKDGAS